MRIQEQLSEQDVEMRRIEYDDHIEFVADLGDGGASVDVVDDTVIVASEREEFDLELPGAGDPQAFMKNGVLTIEVKP